VSPRAPRAAGGGWVTPPPGSLSANSRYYTFFVLYELVIRVYVLTINYGGYNIMENMDCIFINEILLII